MESTEAPMKTTQPCWKATARSRITAVIVWLAFATVSGCNTQAPAVKAAEAKQAMCTACHGLDGKSVSVSAPVLAGQQKAYLVAQLTAFRDHSRADHDASAFMWPMAASLDDPAIDSLATHFSALAPLKGASPVGDVSGGKTIFEKGVTEHGVPACASCHGDKGQGVATFPRLAGQHADYLATQLAAFADGSRANAVMGPMARNLSPDEGRRVADYLATL
jgi:cytochrome c553